MYQIRRSPQPKSCDACGAEIAPGVAFGVSDVGHHLHCGQCAIRFGAMELRACLESIRDRVRRVS